MVFYQDKIRLKHRPYNIIYIPSQIDPNWNMSTLTSLSCDLTADANIGVKWLGCNLCRQSTKSFMSLKLLCRAWSLRCKLSISFMWDSEFLMPDTYIWKNKNVHYYNISVEQQIPPNWLRGSNILQRAVATASGGTVEDPIRVLCGYSMGSSF